MLELLFTLGGVAEAKALLEPDYGYQLPTRRASPAGASTTKPWLLPNLRFDDSQDCLTYLERQVKGFGTLRISQACAADRDQPAPWRSL